MTVDGRCLQLLDIGWAAAAASNMGENFAPSIPKFILALFARNPV